MTSLEDTLTYRLEDGAAINPRQVNPLVLPFVTAENTPLHLLSLFRL